MRLLKVALPLSALALLGTVVFWNTGGDEGAGLTFSEEDLETLRTGVRLSRPQFSGASIAGDIYDFQAAEVVPRSLDLDMADVETLRGRISFRDGLVVTLASEAAEIDFRNRGVILDTGVVVETSDGYRIRTPHVEVDVAGGLLTAEGPIDATGPAGEVRAGGLVIAPVDPDGRLDLDQEVTMRFIDGVRLTYVPQPEETR